MTGISKAERKYIRDYTSVLVAYTDYTNEEILTMVEEQATRALKLETTYTLHLGYISSRRQSVRGTQLYYAGREYLNYLKMGYTAEELGRNGKKIPYPIVPERAAPKAAADKTAESDYKGKVIEQYIKQVNIAPVDLKPAIGRENGELAKHRAMKYLMLGYTTLATKKLIKREYNHATPTERMDNYYLYVEEHLSMEKKLERFPNRSEGFKEVLNKIYERHTTDTTSSCGRYGKITLLQDLMRHDEMLDFLVRLEIEYGLTGYEVNRYQNNLLKDISYKYENAGRRNWDEERKYRMETNKLEERVKYDNC